MEMQRGLMDKGGNELDVSYRFFYWNGTYGHSFLHIRESDQQLWG
jgi:hypothetical protein